MLTTLLIFSILGFLFFLLNTILLIYLISYIVKLNDKLKDSFAVLIKFLENLSVGVYNTSKSTQEVPKTWDQLYVEQQEQMERRMREQRDNDLI